MAPFLPIRFRAIVLAGGRSSRLHASAPGPTPDKPLLSRDGLTLVDAVLTDLDRFAEVGAAECVVVGPENIPLPADAGLVREDPPYSGPAAAIRAGLSFMDGTDVRDSGPDAARRAWVFVVATDMPHPGPGLAELRRAVLAHGSEETAFIGVEDGRWQPLMSVLRLDRALEAFTEPAESQSVMSRLKRLSPVDVELPTGSSKDIDTWDDAVSLGFVDGTAGRFSGSRT